MGTKVVYERFLWLEDRAKAKRYPNASVLARKFEISTKTAQRDILFMRRRLRCPLRYDKNRKGYYYEKDTFSLPLVHLSSEELATLLVARKMLKDLSGGTLGVEISSVVAKLTSVLSNRVITGDGVDEAVSFQGVEYAPASEPVFRASLEGCLRRQRLAFRYYSPARDETTDRTVDPYHLFNYMGTWHLIGWCHLRQTVRDFVLGRMSEVSVQEESFERPDGFSMKEFFESTFGLYKGKTFEKVTLRFAPLKARWIRDQVWHRDQTSKTLKDGSLELTFPVSDFSEVKREILKHGDLVEVVRPAALRRLVKTEAENVVKIYRQG